MNDTRKTKAQLLEELRELRQRVAELERGKTSLKRTRQAATRAAQQRAAELTQAQERLEAELAERTQTEAALRESEQRYRRLLEAVPDMIAVHRDGRFIYANKAGAHLLGAASPAELIGRPVFDFVPREEEEIVKRRIHAVQEEGHWAPPRAQEIVRLDGQTVAVEVTGVPITYMGEPAVQIVIRDITERKRAEAALRQVHDELERRVEERTADLRAANRRLQAQIAERTQAEEALRESEARQGLILRSLPMALYTAQASGDFGATWVSEQIERISGFPPQRWVQDGGFWASGLHPDDRERALGEYAALLVKDEVATEYRWRCADGSYRWFLDQAVLVRDEHGTPKEAIGTWLDITRRKRAEEALREGEQRLQAILDNTTAVIYLKDTNGRYLLINRRYEELFHAPRDEIVGQTDHDVFPQERADAFRANDQQVLRARAPLEFEETAPHDDGLHTYISIKFPLYDAAGVPYGVCGISTDITERKRAEKALRASEELFRTVVTASKDAMVAIDREGLITVFNPAAEEMFGRRRAEMMGQPLDRLMPAEYRALHRQYVQDYFATGSPHNAVGRTLELPAVRADGVVFPIELSLSVGACEDNPVVLAVIRDITERKRAEEALKESEQRYRTLVENIADGVALVVDGKIAYASPPLCKMLGRTAEQMLGRPATDFVVPGQGARVTERVQAVVRGEALGPATYEVHGPDGKRVHVEAVSSAIRRAGQPAVLAVVRDITERKRIEEEKTRLAEQLHEAQKMHAVGQVAVGIAHDFGNLLAVARNGLRQLRASAGPTDEMGQTLEVIEHAVEEATSSTRSLLMFSRRLPAERMPLRLCKLVEDSAPILRHLLPATVALRLETCCDWPCWINADPGQLQQVLLNLTLNARDAMPDGGTLHVAVSPVSEESGRAATGEPFPPPRAVRLIVRDAGVGVSPAVLPRIFEPFFTTKPAGQGTGLGLAAVQSIVRDHGGRIELESEIDRGSTFTVILPGLAPELAATLATAVQPSGRGAVVLLAETNRHIRRLMISTLRSWDYEVLTPTEGASAGDIYFAAPERVALLILSADPPEPSGVECLRRIRAAGHRTPAILTAQTSDPDLEGQLDSRTVLLRKPFQMPQLGACLGKLLARRATSGGDS